MQPTLILGIGNILLRDEGVGVRVVEAMRQIDLPEGVELVDGGTAGADLVDIMADRRKVIVIDAIGGDSAVGSEGRCAAGCEGRSEPGALFRLTADDLLPDEGAAISLHQLGLVQSLAMARQLGCAPEEVVIFGVRPGRIEAGLELSEPVAAVVPAVVEAVLAELRK